MSDENQGYSVSNGMRGALMGTALCFASTVWATVLADEGIASLESVQGAVLVNQGQGQGFTLAHSDMTLSASANLLTRRNSSAELVFADGCSMQVPGNQLIAAQQAAQCCVDDRVPLAILRNVQGAVTVVRQGSQLAAWEGMPLSSEDRVRVGAAGNARVIYAGGCQVPLIRQHSLEVNFAEQCCLGLTRVERLGRDQPGVAQTRKAADSPNKLQALALLTGGLLLAPLADGGGGDGVNSTGNSIGNTAGENAHHPKPPKLPLLEAVDTAKNSATQEPESPLGSPPRPKVEKLLLKVDRADGQVGTPPGRTETAISDC